MSEGDVFFDNIFSDMAAHCMCCNTYAGDMFLPHPSKDRRVGSTVDAHPSSREIAFLHTSVVLTASFRSRGSWNPLENEARP